MVRSPGRARSGRADQRLGPRRRGAALRAVPRRAARGHGELWTDDGEAAVELARLIVDPGQRGQGLGRRLVTELAALARTGHPRVVLRVHPDNTAARRCYAGTAFEPAAPHLAARWNASQPAEYVWLTLATQTDPEPSTSSGNAATGPEPGP
jgi:ribosomal protein S18 acetylase RimI-like enzyme